MGRNQTEDLEVQGDAMLNVMLGKGPTEQVTSEQT